MKPTFLKKLFAIAAFFFLTTPVFAQLGFNVHYSTLPFFGISYNAEGNLWGELRASTDNFIEDVSPEGFIAYNVINQDKVRGFLGIGGRLNNHAGIVLPFGFQAYPFETMEHLGISAEVSLIVAENSLVRGAIGIRYNFPLKKN